MSFIFNKYGVCVNPEVIRIDEHVNLQIAQDDDGMFCTAFDFHFRQWSRVSPCMRYVKYKTRKDALVHIVRKVVAALEKEYSSCDSNDRREIEKSIDNLEEYNYNLHYTQLKLF